MHTATARKNREADQRMNSQLSDFSTFSLFVGTERSSAAYMIAVTFRASCRYRQQDMLGADDTSQLDVFERTVMAHAACKCTDIAARAPSGQRKPMNSARDASARTCNTAWHPAAMTAAPAFMPFSFLLMDKISPRKYKQRKSHRYT